MVLTSSESHVAQAVPTVSALRPQISAGQPCTQLWPMIIVKRHQFSIKYRKNMHIIDAPLGIRL